MVAGNPKERAELKVLLWCGQSDFQFFAAFAGAGFWFEAYFFTASTTVHLPAFAKKSKTLSLADALPPHARAASDSYLRCARLCAHRCHASHVRPRRFESASSCSATCPGLAWLIRKETCGKARSHYRCLLGVGPQQQHRGPGDCYRT